MKSNYLIENATIVNENNLFTGCVLILNGLIHDIMPQNNLSETFIQHHNITCINAYGKILIPGLIDDQVHFREPGLTHKGDIESESSAAVAGGITSYMEMPNTVANTTTIELLEEKYSLAAQKSRANYSFYLGATNDNIQEINKFDPLNNCGIKIFLGASTGNMLVNNTQALERIFSTPFLIAIHSEDETIIQRNTAIYREKYGENVPISCHPLIRSEEACFVSTERAVSLAKKLNTRLHVLHVSTAKELDLFKNDITLQEKRITSEVCVHHLWFNDSAYETHGTKVKWNPAIKTENDRKALFNAILNGTIDIIATDHAPHTWDEKQQTYFKAPSGGPLVQHSLLAMIEFYHNQKISLEKIVDLMCHKPAVCFKVAIRGFIRKNYFADLVLIDLEKETKVDNASLLYKCKWSPFEGQTFNSKIDCTFVNGQIAYDGFQVQDEVRGKRLAFNN
ncbi:MAG: dihydroorotase [Bacteroidota bacterium]